MLVCLRARPAPALLLPLATLTFETTWAGPRDSDPAPGPASMVTFAGDATVWGLEVQSASAEAGQVSVETTAAQIQVNANELIGVQKLSASEAPGDVAKNLAGFGEAHQGLMAQSRQLLHRETASAFPSFPVQ